MKWSLTQCSSQLNEKVLKEKCKSYVKHLNVFYDSMRTRIQIFTKNSES